MSVVCILYATTTAYDSIRGILAMAGAEFDRLGHEVKMINISAPDLADRLNQLLPRRAETIAIGMSGIGLEMYNDGNLLWDQVQIPFFCWYCDHPSYYITRHRLESRFVVHAYVFPDHAAFNRDYLQANGAAFATHIGIPDPGFFGSVPSAQRNGRIVFAKSGWNPDMLEQSWRKVLPPKLFTILFDAIRASYGKTCGAFPQIVLDVAAAHRVYLTPGGNLFNTILTHVDNYTRALRTREVATVLVDYPVDFIGGGWADFAPEGKRARFHGAMPFDSLRKGLGTYLAAASLNPNTDLSMHDRVFFALGAGTVPIFDANGFSRTNLPHLEEFSFGQEPGSIAAAVEAVLANPSAAQAATRETFTEIYPRFSMRRSMEEIHEIATMVARPAGEMLPAAPSPEGVWPPPKQLAMAG
jgi:hypothetical protein